MPFVPVRSEFSSPTIMKTLLGGALLLALGCGDLEYIRNNSGGGGSGAGSNGGAGGDGGEGAGFDTGGGGEGGEGGEPPGPYCGDGIQQANEVCDDGNAESGDGCTGTCDAVEEGFGCLTPGEPCFSTIVCGDGTISGAETCDDGNPDGGDGCSATCTVEPGWICPDVDEACEAALCGDGIVAGQEECEDDDGMTPTSGDGCSSLCQLEPGYKCDIPGQPCELTVCGDGIVEGSEQCDDGNNDSGDLCTPLFCTSEPDCSGSPMLPCTTSCGDGILLPNGTEECEDGNTTAGDGCSPTCQVEAGYICPPTTVEQTELILPVVYRDFMISHPDFESFTVRSEYNLVQFLLGADGKPVYGDPDGTGFTFTTTGAANFDQWYRDVPGVNIPILQTMTFGQLPTGEFQFDAQDFYPLTGLGWGNEGNPFNYHFTSEVRYWFEFKGTEILDFTGDDDVWVFVNKQLAVDLGGVHDAQNGSVNLGADQDFYNLDVGNVYEIVVFQAERQTVDSHYKLTLSNFANATTTCESVCGDGVKTPDEACDQGTALNDGTWGRCTPDCKKGPRCGDGELQPDFEECDDGQNVTPYDGCAPGCVLGATCGDGQVNSLFGEECDDGVNDGGYAQCAPGCVLGDRCGDGVVQMAGGEECDDGNTVDSDLCGNDCKLNVAE